VRSVADGTKCRSGPLPWQHPVAVHTMRFMNDQYRPFDLRTKAGWRALIGVLYLVVGGVMVAVILRS